MPRKSEVGGSQVQRALAAGFDQSVYDRDIGVIQRGETLGFAVEARQTFGIAGEGPGKNLEMARVALQLGDVRAKTSPIPPAPSGARIWY